MKKYKLIFTALLLNLSISRVHAQIVNPADATWTLSPKSDDFDSMKVNNWCPDYCFGKTNGAREYNIASQLSFVSNPGYLTIKCEKLTTPDFIEGNYYYYKSGAISSLDHFKHRYGYFETSAILPQGQGYWPAFWGWQQGDSGTAASPCDTSRWGWYNEIDILENNGILSMGNNFGGGYVYRNPVACWYYLTANGHDDVSVDPSVITDEHKYAVFWESDRITWYFDDNPVYSVYDPVHIPHDSICTVFNFAIDNYIDGSAATFPAYFKINHLKIWQLKADCSTVENFCSSAFNAATYTYKVKKSVSIGASGCGSPVTSTINTSSNVNLWATDFILLDVGTTINPDGSGSFSANVTECPN